MGQFGLKGLNEGVLKVEVRSHQGLVHIWPFRPTKILNYILSVTGSHKKTFEQGNDQVVSLFCCCYFCLFFK